MRFSQLQDKTRGIVKISLEKVIRVGLPRTPSALMVAPPLPILRLPGSGTIRNCVFSGNLPDSLRHSISSRYSVACRSEEAVTITISQNLTVFLWAVWN